MTTVITTSEAQSLEDRVRALLSEGDADSLREALVDRHPRDVAEVLGRLPAGQRLAVFRAVPLSDAPRVLAETDQATTRQLVEALPVEETARLLDRLPMDDAAEILSEDVPDRREELLEAMTDKDAQEVRDLLGYPPESAGRLMTERFVRIQPDMTAAEVLVHLRSVDADAETFTDLYSLDKNGRLEGVVSLREVVVAPPGSPIRELLTAEVVAVTAETDQEDVARLISRYDYLALPVVSDDGQMLGVITVDDVIDVIVQEAGEDILKFGAAETGGVLNEPYFSVSIPRVVRKRFGWLLLLFVAETATGTVLRHFESELAQVVALTFFIPLLIGTGGNTGAQTVSNLIRGLALRDIRLSDWVRILRRELLSGLLLGLSLGAVGFVRALLWGSSVNLSLVVGLSLVAICTWANTIGSLIPLVAQRFRIDPAVISAPLITTLVDATGLAIYLLIAKVVLNL